MSLRSIPLLGQFFVGCSITLILQGGLHRAESSTERHEATVRVTDLVDQSFSGIDLGKISGASTVRVQVTIDNDSDESLEMSLDSVACTCTDTTPKSFVLDCGEKQEVTFAISNTSRHDDTKTIMTRWRVEQDSSRLARHVRLGFRYQSQSKYFLHLPETRIKLFPEAEELPTFDISVRSSQGHDVSEAKLHFDTTQLELLDTVDNSASSRTFTFQIRDKKRPSGYLTFQVSSASPRDILDEGRILIIRTSPTSIHPERISRSGGTYHLLLSHQLGASGEQVHVKAMPSGRVVGSVEMLSPQLYRVHLRPLDEETVSLAFIDVRRGATFFVCDRIHSDRAPETTMESNNG